MTLTNGHGGNWYRDNSATQVPVLFLFTCISFLFFFLSLKRRQLVRCTRLTKQGVCSEWGGKSSACVFSWTRNSVKHLRKKKSGKKKAICMKCQTVWFGSCLEQSSMNRLKYDLFKLSCQGRYAFYRRSSKPIKPHSCTINTIRECQWSLMTVL